VLFSRADATGHRARLALVDGSFIRSAGRRGLTVVLPREVPDLHLDLGADAAEASGWEARLSGPVFGAQVDLSGRKIPIAIERRSTARVRARRREVR
jgi:hypothetical protein